MTAAEFWDHPDKAQEIITQLKTLNTLIKPFEQLASELGDIRAMIELAEEDEGDSMLADIKTSLVKATADVDRLEFKMLMSDPVDISNAFVTIQAGAGGTESCDWAAMLYRMYVHWAEDHHYELELVDADPAEQAGYRSITFAVRGEYAYGYLRTKAVFIDWCDISPFDSQLCRHTSFVAVDVMPELDETIEIDVKDSDIEMGNIHERRARGQHQNKTASGVRLRQISHRCRRGMSKRAEPTQKSEDPARACSRHGCTVSRRRSEMPNSPSSTMRKEKSPLEAKFARTCCIPTNWSRIIERTSKWVMSNTN